MPDLVGAPLRVLAILLVASLLLRTIQRVTPWLRDFVAARQGHAHGDSGPRLLTLSRVVRYVLTVAVTVITGILILGEFGVSVAPILGAAGVVGIAIGFGAQSLVKDFFTGFFLLLENQIRLGDVVEAGGKAGGVEEMTLRYLKLRDYSGNVHYIPNGNITVVTNMSRGFAFAVMDLSVAYDENLDRVFEVMRRVGREMRADEALGPKILEDLEIAGVENWAESAVILRCRFRVGALEQWGIRREFLQRAKEAFDREGIEIPVPQRKVVYAAEALGPNNAPSPDSRPLADS